jgi:hypothetical protein
MSKVYQAAGGAPPGGDGFPGGQQYQGSTSGQTTGPHVDEVDWCLLIYFFQYLFILNLNFMCKSNLDR